jgi:hypothetical protein
MTVMPSLISPFLPLERMSAMKKLLAMFACLGLSVVLVGCGDTKKVEGKKETKEEKKVEKKEGKEVTTEKKTTTEEKKTTTEEKKDGEKK